MRFKTVFLIILFVIISSIQFYFITQIPIVKKLTDNYGLIDMMILPQIDTIEYVVSLYAVNLKDLYYRLFLLDMIYPFLYCLFFYMLIKTLNDYFFNNNKKTLFRALDFFPLLSMIFDYSENLTIFYLVKYQTNPVFENLYLFITPLLPYFTLLKFVFLSLSLLLIIILILLSMIKFFFSVKIDY